MSILTASIRSDPEYAQLLQTVERDFRVEPLPVAVSGICDGASDALLVSLVEDTAKVRKGEPALLICPEEKECVRLLSLLERFGLHAGFFMGRDLTFYYMTASHEYEHERLKTLSGLLGGDYDVILTTPDAAVGYTVPPEKLIASTGLTRPRSSAGCWTRVLSAWNLWIAPGSSPCAAGSSTSTRHTACSPIRTAGSFAARMPCAWNSSATKLTAWGCSSRIRKE